MNDSRSSDMQSPQAVAGRLQQVQRRIDDACSRSGRSPADVAIIAITKRKSVDYVLAGVEAGLRHFGENRVEEASAKIPDVRARTPVPLTWHMVGHVQSRKAADVLGLFELVHSLDSLKLAQRFSRLAQEQGKTLDVLVQVNVSGEDTKSGLEAAHWSQRNAVRAALWQQMEQILALSGLRVRGLMTMAPIVDDMEQTRPLFAGLAALRDALAQSLGVPLPELSMGMTDDYPVAIEEGATMVRIGRAIFGERD
ncbi:MAG: YggS family pyridoxal phosphate-dependent enzyme [Phototrophicaceae bacterium]